MPGKDKLKKLHATLVRDGYDMPGYEEFEKDMADSAKLRKLHTTLVSDGYDMPDFEMFLDDMGYKKKDPSVVSGIGGEAGSFAGPSGKSNAQKVKEYVSALPGAKPKVLSGPGTPVIREEDIISTSTGKKKRYRRPVFSSPNEYQADIEASAKTIVSDFERNNLLTIATLAEKAEQGDPISMQALEDFQKKTESLLTSEGAKDYASKRMAAIDKEEAEIEKVPVSLRDETQKARLAELVKERNSIQYSANRVIEHAIVSDALKKAIPVIEENSGDPVAMATSINTRNIGRQVVANTMKDMNDVLTAIEEEKGDVGPINSAFIDQVGINAISNVIASTPELQNENLIKVIDAEVRNWEASHPEIVAARAKHKVAAKLYKQGNWIYNIPPTVKKLKEIGDEMQGSGEFSPEEARAYREFVIPKEESLWWGTDIPMNGLLNKIGEGFQQSVSALGQLIDKTAMSSNSDIVYQASNAPADTRFQDVGEYDEGKQRLKDLGEKKTLTKEEQKEQADLKTYVGVRNRWNKIVDGSGGLAGQVLGMGMYSKALAAPLRATGKALTIPYLTRPAGKWLASDATALQVASIIQELPSKMEEYAMIFPKAEDKPLRMLYAGTSAYVVSKLEGIFDDRKVLDAFMAKATPSLKRFVREAGTGRVSKEAAATAWKDMVSALKTYSKEFVKEANNNAMEEAFQDMSADFLKGEDMTKVISRGFDTYTTTLMHSPLVAGVAAYGNAKSKAPFKAGLYSVAKDPSGAMEEVSRLLNDGVITKQEAKEKVAIIARASKMQKELPENIGEPEKAVYLLHRLNESLIDDQLAATTDEVLAKKLKDQKQRSMDIRQGIFDGEIIVGDNLSEMALTDSTAKKLLIDGPKTVDRDDAPAVLELITDKDGNKLLDVEQGTIEGEKAETWYRGVRPENEGSEDSFFSADKDIAGDYSKSTTGSDGKIDQLSNEELPKNPLRIGSKEDLADIIGYEGDPLAEPLDTPAEEKFDNLAKKYAQAKGHDAIIYESGTMDQPELHLFKKPVQSGAGVSVTAIDQKETVRQMTPIAEDMAGIELEFENNGFSIDTDYDNEIIITDKSGEIVDPEDLPAKLSPLAARYEAAASRMGEFDDSAREMALKEARKKISGDPADYIDLDKENSKTQTDEKANTHDGQKEGEKELLTPEENQAEQKPSSPSQKIQEWEQPRGPWKVVYENGKRVIKAKRGKKVMPEYITVKKKGTGKNKGRVIEVKVKNSEWTRLALQHAKSINYNQGETAQSKQAPEFNDPIEAAKWTIENSDNPAEIAMAWLQTPKMPAPLSATEAAIANAGVGKVKQSSFNEFNDRNNITFSLAKTYFSKSGKTLDQVAQEASDYDEGVPVTPEDVANFMIRFPFGVNADGLQKTEAHYMAEKKFEELTGVPLAANRGTEAVANLAAGQFRPDLQQAALEQMPDNAADVDMQKVMSTEAFTGWSPVDVGADFDNLKNEQNDQAAENQSDSGSDGGQSGGQSETSRGNGTTEGGTGGSSAGRNGGQQGSGGTDSTEQPGAGAGAAEGAGTPESGEYTESDFLNEIQAIGPLGSGEEDMGDLEEAPFMAVSERSALQQMAKEMGLPATGTNEDLADLIRIGNTHPSLWSREDFDKISPHLAIHQDIRPGSEERVTSIVSNGLNSGMADSVSSIERGEHSWSGGLKDGDAYVFLWGNVKFKGKDNPAFAPGNKPMFHIKTKEGQSIFDALQTADNFRPEEPSMMAASTTEALLKEAEKAVGRAQRELSAAEDKIAKTKAQQGGMFGGATQGSMFSVDRDEAMDILNPLRVKLKQAREERDRLASKLRDEQSQADGQMSLFKTIPQSYPMATRKSFSRVASAIKRLFSRDKSFQGVSVLSGEDFQSAMSMTGATTPFNFIGGKSSFGAAMENKRTAEIMAAKPGADMEEIFKATGWYIDRNDRKWKFELPNNSRVLPVPVPPGKSMITKLDKVLDYPELYQAYPDAKNINVVFTPLPDTMDAAYNPKTNTILINNGQQREKNTEAEFELHQSIRHEVQHYIQHKEGFATGASKEREGVRERDRYLVSARDRLNGLKRIYEKMPPLSPAAEEIRNQIESLEDYAEMIEADMDGAAEYFYRAYAGEIEARNVEKRMRAATPSGSPNSTSDRAPQSHITTEFSEESFRFMSRPDGTVYGFVHKGTIYLNGSVLNLNTPIHEASHLFTKWAKRNNPELYLAGQRLAATSRMISQVKGQPFYRDQAERMRAAGKSESDIEQMFRDEALAFAVGNRGASIADADTRSSFRRWLQKFWDAVKRIFTGSRRLEEMTAEDFSNMTFDSLANAMAERILDGSPLKEGPVEGEAGSFMATGSSKGMKMARAVQKLLANGHTEQQAKTLLMTSGYSDLVAENIISNAKRLPKYFPLQPNPSTAGTPTPTPSGTIKYEGDTRSWFDKKMDVVGRFFSKYFTVNKGMPELIIPLSEKVRGERDWEVQQAFRTVKELKAAAEKEGFTDWDKVDEALRNLKSLRNQVQLSGSSAITGFNPALAAYNRQLSMAPAVVPQVLQNLPASMRPIVIKMRDQIDSLTAHMVSNGYVSPELAMVLDNNIGEYMTRGYEAYNSRGWAKRVSEKVKEDALNFLYYQSFAEIKAADPSIPDADAELQAKEMATKRLQAILDGIDIEYSPVKTSVVKGRNNGILDKREDIPKPIRDLLGEYKDPGEAFMVTISKLASLKSQAKFLADVRDIGMGSIFWEANDPKRPVDASVELRSSGTGAWFPLGGLYTTREVAEYFNEEEYLRNDATNAWMKLVGAVRWGKTVGSVVTQIKNFESNIGFAVMNGHLNFGKASGEPLEYLWDQMKWWDGEKMDGELLEKASKLGLIGQNVGVRELQEMLGSKNVRRLITAASTAKDGPLKKISRSPVKLFDYLNKLYSASDDFFKLYGFVNERDMLSKAKYGIPYDQVAPQDQVEIDEMAAERVKNTYPTYDRVVTGAKYLSKNMPIFGNFLSFQAESIRVFMNTVKYAVSDIKNPETRSAGLRRLAGITTYLGSRTAILYALSQITGVGMNTFFGAGDDDDEQRLDDINRFTIPFTRSGEKLVLPNGPGRYTVYDITSVEPYGIIFKTMNAFRSGSENNAKPGIMAVLDEFIGPFSEREMTFEVVRQIWSNDNGKGARIYNPKEPAGNNFVDMLSFAIDKLEPSTIGFVKRMIERDSKANEIMAMIGARGYDLDVNKAFSIKIFKAEEEIAMMDKDYFNEVRQVKDGKTLDKIAEKYDNELRKVMVSLHADMRAAIRLGADATAIQERIGKAYKKVFDPYQKTDIQIILEGDGDTFRFRRRAAGATNRVD